MPCNRGTRNQLAEERRTREAGERFELPSPVRPKIVPPIVYVSAPPPELLVTTIAAVAAGRVRVK
jgi:hypothetical protein